MAGFISPPNASQTVRGVTTVGTKSGNALLLAADDKLPALDGSDLTGISAGFTPNYAILEHAGAWTAYATLGAAKTAAVSGDLIRVGPGTYDETDLAKDGVNWDFAHGANVIYTGATTTGIWDDGGAAMTFSVSGHGTFINNGSASKSPVKASNAATVISIEADTISSIASVFCSCVELTNGTVYFKARVLGRPADYSKYGVYLSGGTVYGSCDTIYASERAVAPYGGGTAYITADTITSSSGEAIMCYNATLHLQAKRIIGGTVADGAVRTFGGSSKAWVTVDTITTVSDSYRAVSAESSSTLYLTVKEASIATSSAKTLYVSGGATAHVFGGRFVNANANGIAAELDSAGTLITYGSVAFISGASATDSITASGAQTMKSYGTVVGNKALNANVTIQVAPAANAIFSDANVT